MPFATLRGLLRDESSLWPNLAALAYIAVGYAGGWWALFQPQPWLNALGVLALAHAMVIAAYLIHDCAHNAVFRLPQHNTRLGAVLNWFTGGCYGRFDDLRYKHLRHHSANADLISFDYRGLLQRRPLLRRVVLALEWCHVPAVELLMHAMQIAAPFALPGRSEQRRRVLAVGAVRFALLALVAWLSLRALLLYALAYLLLLIVLRFMDAFQHTYEIALLLDDRNAGNRHRGDADYEERNTYSNLISQRWPWLNLLTLNFAYHNAHHRQPLLSWHRLPRLHRELYGEGCPQQLGFGAVLACFHRHRVERVMGENDEHPDMVAAVTQGRAVGANALNFLTAF